MTLVRRSGPVGPHEWVVGDDEFGRASEFRAALRGDGEHCVRDVPYNTNIRDLDGRRPSRKRAHKGAKRKVPFVRIDTWARKLPTDRWTRSRIRDGAKGPLEVEEVSGRVRDKHLRRIGPEERAPVIRTLDPKPDWTYSMSNAPPVIPLIELVRVRSSRYRVEAVFQQAKGEVGMGHYEVRNWVGWHHHITPALPSLWFLILERGRMGGQTACGDGGADASDLRRIAPQTAADGRGDRRGGRPSLAA